MLDTKVRPPYVVFESRPQVDGQATAEAGYPVYKDVVYLPCTEENGFKAEPPKDRIEALELKNCCFPVPANKKKED